MKNFKKTFLLLALVITFLIPGKVSKAEAKVFRIQGVNRYQTSVNVSKTAFDSSDNVIIASGMSFADALSGSGLANELEAPLLLVQKDEIPGVVLDEVKRLGAKKAYVLGGNETITDKTLKTLPIEKERIAGRNRLETSLKIAEKIESPKTWIITNGFKFPDALVAGSLVEPLDGAIILTDGQKLPWKEIPNTGEFLALGGANSVSDTLVKSLNAKRLTGRNRYETSMGINQFINLEKLLLVDGSNFPDALSASSLAMKDYGIFLVGDDIDSKTLNYLQEKKELIILGGPASVSQKVEDKLKGVKETYLTHTNDPSKKTPEMHERDIIMMRGEFKPEFIYGISREEFSEIKSIAKDRLDKAVYWDLDEFICQAIELRYPGNSQQFPNELTNERWFEYVKADYPHRYRWDKNRLFPIADEYGGPSLPTDSNDFGANLLKDISDEEMRDYMLEGKDLFYRSVNNDYPFYSFVKMLIMEDYPEIRNTAKSMYNNYDYYDSKVLKSTRENQPVSYDELPKENVKQYYVPYLKPSSIKLIEQLSMKEGKDVYHDQYRKFHDENSLGLGDIGRVFSELGYLYPGTIIDIDNGLVYGVE